MDKKLIYIAVALIVLLLLGAGAFFMMNKPSAPQMTQNETGNNSQTAMTPEPSQPASNMKTLKDLLAAGTSQKCTYADKTEDVDVSGTSYISAGKIRGDFSTTTAGKTIAGHMIVDGKTSYVWMDGQKTGFKMSFDTTNTDGTTNKDTQAIDPNKAFDFNCSAWTVDTTMFALPKTVTFTDLSKMTAPSVTNQCAICSSLSGEEKTQCETTLKCN